MIDDPPAKVEAMQIQLKPGAMPFVCGNIRMVTGIYEVVNEKLVNNKLAFKIPKARWASAILPVKKPVDKKQTT